LSFGERLSSEIVAAAFERKGMYGAHINACDEAVTDDAFTKATPLHWETYAKLRRIVALAARDSVVMGGFIGANTRRPGHHARARRLGSHRFSWWARRDLRE
jgi:aspartate kinase